MVLLKQLLAKIQFIVQAILLNIVYIISIGGTSLVAKLFGKKFINTTTEKTNWEKPSESENYENMY